MTSCLGRCVDLWRLCVAVGNHRSHEFAKGVGWSLQFEIPKAMKNDIRGPEHFGCGSGSPLLDPRNCPSSGRMIQVCY